MLLIIWGETYSRLDISLTRHPLSQRNRQVVGRTCGLESFWSWCQTARRIPQGLLKFYMYLDIVQQPAVTIICASGLVTSVFSISVCIGLLALEVCNYHWREKSKEKLISSWFEQRRKDFGLKAENVWMENHDLLSLDITHYSGNAPHS